ncbi:hypothetical protein KFZ76_11030 [Methylovulum psychrotolerans]|uniref:hypothetical protein n=1 Tax=Methylovulum psychrotolerans TaxID=1704499 RepID=UPI001BFFAB2E|nr:hypothetical protein [Methylovulum psychrotolerans]MBT9098236.1 hypothetical protein [Methylovulum psychrotolerans]
MITKARHFPMKSIFYVKEAPPFIKRMVEDKRCIQAYLRGEMTKEELEKRGIKLANPL